MYFSKQKGFCQICGIEFESEWAGIGRDRRNKGRLCSDDCYDKWWWKFCLSIRGKEYGDEEYKKYKEKKDREKLKG